MSLIKRAGSAERNISARVLTHTRRQRITTHRRMNRNGPWTLFPLSLSLSTFPLFLLSLGRSRKMRLGVHTSSFMRQKPSSHTRCVYESGRIKREVALKPKGCVAPFASFARDFVRKKNFEKEKNIWLFSSYTDRKFSGT